MIRNNNASKHIIKRRPQAEVILNTKSKLPITTVHDRRLIYYFHNMKIVSKLYSTLNNIT